MSDVGSASSISSSSSVARRRSSCTMGGFIARVAKLGGFLWLETRRAFTPGGRGSRRVGVRAWTSVPTPMSRSECPREVWSSQASVVTAVADLRLRWWRRQQRGGGGVVHFT